MLDFVIESRDCPPGGAEREVCVWRDPLGTPFARAFARGAERWIEWPGLGTFAFSAGSQTIRVWPAASIDAAVVADACARVIQPIILQALGRQALHASGVLGVEGVIAFCGLGRSGKSTLAFALADEGFQQIADDAVVIERTGPLIVSRFLPFAPGLREPSRQHFADRRRPRHELRPTDQTAPLRLVILLQQDAGLAGPEGAVRVPPVAAFAALVTHARCFDEADADHTRRLVDDYLAIAEAVPVYAIRYPARFGQMRELLERVKQAADTEGVTPLAPRPRLAVIP